MTEAVYQRLHDRYRFSDVLQVDVKGKGLTPTRFLLGRDEASATDDRR